MKKSLIVLSVLLVGAIIVVPIITSKRRKLSEKDYTTFAVKDIEKIDSVFLSHGNNHVLLGKQPDGRWLVNGKFYASQNKVDNLMEAIGKIEFKNPVSKTAQTSIINNLATDGVKVEIYQGAENMRTYYIGHTTNDEMGNFMWLQDAPEPVVVNLPGFSGYVSARYETDELLWRDKNIFSAPVNEFKSVSVKYPDSAQNNFTLEKDPLNNFKLSNGQKSDDKVNQNFAKMYAAQFGNLTVEGYVNASASFVDSVSNAIARCEITVTKTDGKTRRLRIFYKPVTAETKRIFDDQGRPLAFDSDRYYALVDDSKELAVVQDYLFRNVFKRYDDFVAR